MREVHIREFIKFVLCMTLVLNPGLTAAEEPKRKLTDADCRVTEGTPTETDTAISYGNALLWQISKQGAAPSYVFGTIHVSDERITTLPEPVKSALTNADIFVMEALPSAEEALVLSQMMFYADGGTLNEYLDDALFNRVAKILLRHQFPVEAVSLMKPWAAYLMMNYPVSDGLPLDLKLYEIANEHGAKTMGLETLAEQGAVFNDMAVDAQLGLLLDTVCNHDAVIESIEEMKLLYLERDLSGLMNAGLNNAYIEEPIYQGLKKRLLTDRNRLMTQRMLDVLNEGNAFIAIGALHLPGEDGVIARLNQLGYKISAIY